MLDHLILGVDEVGGYGFDFLLVVFMFAFQGGQIDVCVLIFLLVVVMGGMLHIFIFIMNKSRSTLLLFLRFKEENDFGKR